MKLSTDPKRMQCGTIFSFVFCQAIGRCLWWVCCYLCWFVLAMMTADLFSQAVSFLHQFVYVFLLRFGRVIQLHLLILLEGSRTKCVWPGIRVISSSINHSIISSRFRLIEIPPHGGTLFGLPMIYTCAAGKKNDTNTLPFNCTRLDDQACDAQIDSLDCGTFKLFSCNCQVTK